MSGGRPEHDQPRHDMQAAMVKAGFHHGLDCDAVLDVLLPVVVAHAEQRARQAAADELEKAAREAQHGFINSRNDEGEQWARWLRDRAAALREPRP